MEATSLLLVVLVVGLPLAYYTLKRASRVRLSAKGKSFVVTGAASGFGKEGVGRRGTCGTTSKKLN